MKKKIFFFGAYEYNNRGRAAASVGVLAPTAAGLTALNALAANQAVKDILSRFPVAPQSNGKEHCSTGPTDPIPQFSCINNTPIPVGQFQATAPDFFNQHSVNATGDIDLSKHAIRLRFLYDRLRQPNQNPDLPIAAFMGSNFANNKKAIVTDFWTISNRLVAVTRVTPTRRR